MSQYFKIGKFAASHGLTGELILAHSLGKKTALPGLEALFLETSKPAEGSNSCGRLQTS